MRNTILAVLLTVSCITISFSQKLDNVWILGYHYYYGYDLLPGLDFYYGNPDTVGFNSPIELQGTDASICSADGDLLMYTNGIFLMNRYNQKIPGSEDFNADSFSIQFGAQYLADPQGSIIVPAPGQDGQYYIIHVSGRLFPYHVDTTTDYFVNPFRLAYSVVDINAHGGQGQMTIKNQTILADTLLNNTLQLVRHGNGRDWWIIDREFGGNRFYTALLTPSGIGQVKVQDGGPEKVLSGDYCQSVVSPDGSWYIMTDYKANKCYLWHFDRCSGQLTFNTDFGFDEDASAGHVAGCTISPGSNRLYVGNFKYLYQYDLTAVDIASSRQTVATWDGFIDFNATGMWGYGKLGPDHRIYLECAGTQYFHVIEHPDLPGTDCGVQQHSLKLISYNSASIPSYPNFKLGKMAGSVCDSLMVGTTEISQPLFSMLIQPNPVEEVLQLVCNDGFDFSGKGELTVVSPDGKQVWSGKPLGGKEFRLNAKSWATGVYLIQYSGPEGHWEGRFIKI
jgi:hypothetical protein